MKQTFDLTCLTPSVAECVWACTCHARVCVWLTSTHQFKKEHKINGGLQMRGSRCSSRTWAQRARWSFFFSFFFFNGVIIPRQLSHSVATALLLLHQVYRRSLAWTRRESLRIGFIILNDDCSLGEIIAFRRTCNLVISDIRGVDVFLRVRQ